MRFLAFLLPLFLFAACFNDSDEVEEYVKVGDALPALSLTLNDGSKVTNADFTGKTVLLVFFSITCSDCQKELPEIQRLYDSVKDDTSIMLIAVSRGETESVVKPFWEKYGLTFPYSAQSDRKVYNLFASSVVPRIYITNPSGIVVAAYDDSNMPSAELLLSVIENSRNQ